MLGIVPSLGLNWKYSSHYGRQIEIPNINGSVTRICTLKGKTINIYGAKIFNSLPRYLREFNGEMDQFKCILDKYLECVPDCPLIEGYISHNMDGNGRMSNTLLS